MWVGNSPTYYFHQTIRIMSNVLSNRLSVQVTDGDMTAIQQHLKDLTALLPFLIGLTPRERETLPKIDVNNKAFVEDAINALHTENLSLPNGISSSEMQKDLVLYQQLDSLELQLLDLLTKVRHTKILAGSEAYTSALFIYRLAEAYHLAGVPGYTALYNQLRKRFMGQGGNGTASNTDDSTEKKDSETPQ